MPELALLISALGLAWLIAKSFICCSSLIGEAGSGRESRFADDFLLQRDSTPPVKHDVKEGQNYSSVPKKLSLAPFALVSFGAKPVRPH
jgi:hypothetical protein